MARMALGAGSVLDSGEQNFRRGIGARHHALLDHAHRPGVEGGNRPFFSADG